MPVERHHPDPDDEIMARRLDRVATDFETTRRRASGALEATDGPLRDLRHQARHAALDNEAAWVMLNHRWRRLRRRWRRADQTLTTRASSLPATERPPGS